MHRPDLMLLPSVLVRRVAWRCGVPACLAAMAMFTTVPSATMARAQEEPQSAAALAVEVDGRIDPEEWRDAQHVVDFRKVQPLNGEPASLPTEAWILATADGLAIAFRNTQPPSVPRTKQRVQRDFEAQVDRVNVMIDFDGDHRTGYNFTLSSTNGVFDAIITNEADFNPDWDGNWRHAVGEDEDTWSAEVLIPWHIAPMRDAAGDTRTLGIYLDRVVGATGERVAWPLASFERPRFLSDFAPIEVATHSQSLLALTPYVSTLYDNVRSSGEVDGGLDVFWKPNGQVQLTATVNPDFGQVESDDLVVSFDATETFISDKRPFFTENQGIFEFTTPSDDSQLLYTRRIGGPADDGVGSGDILGALKLNGSIGATKYGIFGADEADEVGRSFGALRIVRDLSTQNLGLMVTQVERPFLDREATVLGIDHNWRPTARWNVRTRLIGSDIEEAGQRTRGTGATLWADYEMDHGWRQQWIGMHFGNDLQINDAGYLQRNSVNYVHWQVNRRFTDLPAESRYASKDWRWRVSTDHNDHGELVNNQFRVSRESRLRNGSYEYAQINVNSARVDDLLTRGHGVVDLPPSFDADLEYERPRKGNWAYDLEAEVYSGGLEGNDKVGYSLYVEPTYFLSDAFNVYVGLYADRTPGWLVWQRENLIGSFDGRQRDFNAGFNWTISNRQELRLKLQAIAVTRTFEKGIASTQAVAPCRPLSPSMISACAMSASNSATATSSRRSPIYISCTAAVDTTNVIMRTIPVACSTTASAYATMSSCWSRSATGSSRRQNRCSARVRCHVLSVGSDAASSAVSLRERRVLPYSSHVTRYTSLRPLDDGGAEMPFQKVAHGCRE